VPAFVRLDLWSALQCQPGATRLGFLRTIARGEAPAVFSVASDESFTVTVAAKRCLALGLATGMVIAVVFSDGSFDEWRVSQTVETSTEWTITCTSVMIDLVDDDVFVEPAVSGFPTFASGMADVTATAALEAIIADRASRGEASIPLFVGTVSSTTVLPSVQWDTAGTVARINAIQQAVLATGEACEPRARRNGTSGYYIDLVDQVGGSAPLLSLRIGKHLVGDTQVTRQRQDQATVVIMRGGDLAGFPTAIGLARWLITDLTGSVATLADPAGGAGPIGADGQFVDGALYREADGTLLAITDSSFANQTVTLSDPGALAEGDVVQFRTTSDPDTAKPIVELPYPSRVATYGRKVGTFQRSAVIGVPNVAPNGVLNDWPDPTAMPRGYTAGTQGARLGPYSATPTPIASGGWIDIAQNTDPDFASVGARSLHFRALGGEIVSAPLKFVPWYLGQPLSLRIRIMPVSGFDATANPAAWIRVWLGIMRAEGTVKQWLDPSRIISIKPTGSTTYPSTYKELSQGVWDDIELNASDITAASTLGAGFSGVTDDDIAALATDALGLVAVTEFFAESSTPIEGYYAAVFLAPAAATPDGMSEFGGANTLHQTGNLVLGEVSRETIEITATVLDLERANPTANAIDKIVLGGNARLVDAVAPNEAFRQTQYTPDYLTAKKAQVVFGSLRKTLADLLVGAGDGSVQLGGASSAGALGSTASGTGVPVSGGGGGGLPAPVVTLTLDGSNVPTAVWTVPSGVVKTFYAWSTSAQPTAADALAGTEIDAPSDFTATTSAITTGDTVYITVVGQDALGQNTAAGFAHHTLTAPPTPALSETFGDPDTATFVARAATAYNYFTTPPDATQVAIDPSVPFRGKASLRVLTSIGASCGLGAPISGSIMNYWTAIAYRVSPAFLNAYYASGLPNSTKEQNGGGVYSPGEATQGLWQLVTLDSAPSASTNIVSFEGCLFSILPPMHHVVSISRGTDYFTLPPIDSSPNLTLAELQAAGFTIVVAKVERTSSTMRQRAAMSVNNGLSWTKILDANFSSGDLGGDTLLPIVACGLDVVAPVVDSQTVEGSDDPDADVWIGMVELLDADLPENGDPYGAAAAIA
jgi:hypothetical protein